MVSESIADNLEWLSAVAERIAENNESATEELLAWLDERSDSQDIIDIRRIAGAVTNLVRALRNHEQELLAKNQELTAALSSAQARERELTGLYEVAKAITSHLDGDELILELEEKIKSLLDADACSLVVHSPRGQRLSVVGPGLQFGRRTTVPEHIDYCEAEALLVATSGCTRYVNNMENCKHCRYKDLAVDNGVHHMLSVPMRSQKGLIGAVNAFRLNKPAFDPADERKLSIIASAAAIALENAEAYRRERDMADKLQRGIQPGSSFELPRFSVGCDYVPATDGTKVGGDFYDVVDIGGGRVGVVMADISGKGIDAAVYTAMARFTLRGLMLTGLDPAAVLEKLNRVVYSFVPDDIFITLFYGVLDINSLEMTYTNAGHDQPLVFLNRHKCCIECDVTGRALGMVQESCYASRRLQFEPGDMIVLYTDGITEARRGNEFFGLDRLRELVVEFAGRNAAEMVTDIFTAVKSFAVGGLRDDAGLLALKALSSPDRQ
ncbi:MAG: SpoIIE family protein phosphatase [Armatimonadetes bacterium]|nr:SpoIIE family protein phosphatase [Armatimonadota bacterium]